MSDSLSTLIRLTDGRTVIYEGELEAGNVVDLGDGPLRLEVLWIRQHAEPPEDDGE